MDKYDDPNFVFTYDETSPSCLRWKNPKKKMKEGAAAGTFSKKDSVWCVQFRGIPRPSHRIIWEMFNGAFDSRDIVKFRNGDKTDPRISNLYLDRYSDKNPQAVYITEGKWREVFDYFDGELYWKDNFWTGRNRSTLTAERGQKLHSIESKNGYLRASVSGVGKETLKLVHRVIYEWHHGEIPEGMQIDHINGIKTDNRIENLRLVTRATNMRNRKKSKKNTTGVTGVKENYYGTSYIAFWWKDGKEVSKAFRFKEYGREKAFELACKTREEAIRKLNEQYGDEAYTEDHGERVLD
jgi:hypothetical protein